VKRELASVSYFNEEKINDLSHLVVFSAVYIYQINNEVGAKKTGKIVNHHLFPVLYPVPKKYRNIWLKI